MGTISDLVQQLDSDNEIERRVAIFDLAETGHEAVQPLVIALGDSRPRIRWGAALALGKLGTTAGSAVPTLIQALGDTVDQVRRCACDALAQIGGTAEPQLVAALESADANRQAGAAAALGCIGRESTQTTEKLLGLLTHEYSFVRRQAAHALGRLCRQEVRRLVETLRESVQAQNWVTAEEAIVALRDTGIRTEEVSEAVFDAWWRGRGKVSDEALTTLRCIDPTLQIRQNRKSRTVTNPSPVIEDSLRELLRESLKQHSEGTENK